MGSLDFNSSEYPVNQFLKAILEGLNNVNIEYCVERNYEGYPLQITGDVDLLVRAEDLVRAVKETCRIAKKQNWKPYIKYETRQLAHVGFYSSIYPDRFVLVIEFFTGGLWRGFHFLKI